MNENKSLFDEMPSQQLPSLPRSSEELMVEQELSGAHLPIAPESSNLAALVADTTPRFLQARRLIARRLLGGLAVALAVVAALGFVRPAQAKVIEVPCWPGIVFSMRSAILDANSTPGHDEILIIRQCVLFEVSIDGDYGNGNVGLPLITDDLTIRGKGSTVKRALNDNERFRLLESANGVKLTLENLTFEGGIGEYGGGIRAGGALTLTQVTMQLNTANGLFGQGGGVYAASSVVISASTFLTNTGQWHGGALFAKGNVTVQGNSRFVANKGRVHGGAISSQGAIVIYDSTFLNNEAISLGGAIFADEELYVEGSAFGYNKSEVGGGAIYADRQLTVLSSRFDSNSAGSYGGAIAAHDPAVVQQSVFLRNTTEDRNFDYMGGGAIYALDELRVQGKSFHFNRSKQDGGAIVAIGDLYLSEVDLRSNQGRYGGAVYAAQPSEVTLAIFSQNKGYYGGALYSVAATTILTSSIEENEALTGGGIYVAADAVVRDTKFSRNKATDNELAGGGGAVIYRGRIIESDFSRNASAQDGGGLLVFEGVEINGSTFHANGAKRSGGGIALYQTSSPSTRTINNLFLDNEASQGSALAIGPAGQGVGGTVTLAHNTIVRSEPGGSAAISTAIATLNLQSNILTNYSTGVAAINGPVNADYNLFFGNIATYTGATAGVNDLTADPLFVDAGERDYHLTENSPAVDSAPDQGIVVDMDKKARPLGDSFDRGAFEFTPLEAGISGFTANHSGPTVVGNATYFSATVAAGDNVNYYWKFGDDSGAVGASVSHTYTETGTYTVGVTARNSVSRVSTRLVVEVVPAVDEVPDDEVPDDEVPDDSTPDDGEPDDGESGDDDSTTGGDPDDDNPGNDDPSDGDPDDGDPDDDAPGGNEPGDDEPDDDPPPLVSIYLPLTMR